MLVTSEVCTGKTTALLDILSESMHKTNSPIGVEIGVHRGNSSRLLLQSFQNLTLIMVDPWKQSARQSDYYASGDGCAKMTQPEHEIAYRESVEITEEFSDRRIIVRTTSTQAARVVSDDLTFVFVDGNHTYAAVKNDLLTWYPKILPGGVLCGHDMNHPRDRSGKWGVTKAVREISYITGIPYQEWPDSLWSMQIPPTQQ